MSHRNHPRNDSARNERDIRPFQPPANYQSRGQGQERYENPNRDFSERAMERGRDWDSNQIEPEDEWRSGGDGRARGMSEPFSYGGGNRGGSNYGQYSGMGFGNQGFGNPGGQGYGPGFGNQGFNNPGYGSQGFGQNFGNQGFGNPGYGQSSGNPSFGNQGYSSQGYSQNVGSPDQPWQSEPRPQHDRGGFGSPRSMQGGWQPSSRGQDSRGPSGYGDWQTSGPHTGKGPKGYQRSDDRIREDVSDQLTQHGDVDASLIEVEVKNGEVTLRGTVDSRQAKRMAEDAADNVAGVRQVNNQLRVVAGQGTTGVSQGDGGFRGGSSFEESTSKRGKGLEH